jgi:hypothetical protein
MLAAREPVMLTNVFTMVQRFDVFHSCKRVLDMTWI